MVASTPSIRVRNHAFIEDFEIEIKPVTVFVGEDEFAKHFLVKLIWLTLSLEPSVNTRDLTKLLSREEKIVRKLEAGVNRGEDVNEAFRELVERTLYSLPEIIEEDLNEKIERTFEVEIEKISRGSGLEVELKGSSTDNYSVRIKHDKTSGKMKLEYIDFSVFRKTIDKLTVDIKETDSESKYFPYSYSLKLIGEDESEKKGRGNLARILKEAIEVIVENTMKPWFCSKYETFFAVSGRSVIIPYYYKHYPYYVEKDVSLPDSVFAERFSDLLVSKNIDMNVVKRVFSILGVRRIHRDSGVIVLKNGLSVPFYKSPPGIREALTPLFALANKKIRFVIIENPEAYLPVSAVVRLGESIARAVSEVNKYVIFSTNSDNLMIKIGNLIGAYRIDEETRRKLGFKYCINPDNIAVYEFIEKHGKTVVKPAEIEEDSIDLKSMSKVATELLNESSLIKLAENN